MALLIHGYISHLVNKKAQNQHSQVVGEETGGESRTPWVQEMGGDFKRVIFSLGPFQKSDEICFSQP